MQGRMNCVPLVKFIGGHMGRTSLLVTDSLC